MEGKDVKATQMENHRARISNGQKEVKQIICLIYPGGHDETSLKHTRKVLVEEMKKKKTKWHSHPTDDGQIIPTTQTRNCKTGACCTEHG